MKKILTIVLAIIMVIIPSIYFTGCNYSCTDTFKLEFNYTIIQQGDKRVLHKIKSWSDSESESVTVTCECCGNYIWFSSNNGELYKNKPNSEWFDCECRG